MANCHSIFIEYNGAITLVTSKKKSLKGSRKELRRKIRKFFEEEKPDEIKPKFKGQGSWETNTTIEPIPRIVEVDGKKKSLLYYDVDDGVYFIGEEEIKDRKSIQTYHDWIYDAVKDHTDKDPIDKNTCVRVMFADGHNIDLPIYYKKGDTPELAHKRDGWVFSDPKEFAEWFNKKADKDEQLRRIVRYLKGWKDYREFCREDKSFPSGLVLSVLAANNFYANTRDDIAFKETLINIEAALSQKFECKMPTTPVGENLLSKYTQKDYFLEQLRNLIKDAKKALEESNQKKSCEYWQKHLGDRMPCNLAEDKDESASASIGLASLIPASTKPWGQRYE